MINQNLIDDLIDDGLLNLKKKCKGTYISSLQITANVLSDELEWMLHIESLIQLDHQGTDIFAEVFSYCCS